MPTAAQDYTISELKLCRLAIDVTIAIDIFSHLLKRANFDAVVDHLVLAHIMKCKSESAS